MKPSENKLAYCSLTQLGLTFQTKAYYFYQKRVGPLKKDTVQWTQTDCVPQGKLKTSIPEQLFLTPGLHLNAALAIAAKRIDSQRSSKQSFSQGITLWSNFSIPSESNLYVCIYLRVEVEGKVKKRDLRLCKSSTTQPLKLSYFARHNLKSDLLTASHLSN